VDMAEARGRFDESAKQLIAALESGFIEGDGPFYKQKRTELRPRPTRSFRDRTYAVAMSPESTPVVAELGARMMFFNLFEIATHLPGVEAYRAHFATHHGRPAPPVHVIDVTFCDRDAGHAERIARDYIGKYYLSVLDHYELFTNYHKTTKSY
jgi:alkanesulfonate monooxygenase SsuD/methylene tetrahydromethanopterin reductase-like flavin-dependent oxidoreductase (luciferase family)